MRNNVTALCNPKVLGRIRLAMRLAIFGNGDLMNGHDHRCYVPNRKGNNIVRVSYYPASKTFEFYGDQGRNISPMIKAAFERAASTGVQVATKGVW
jgi:hypothetical protein